MMQVWKAQTRIEDGADLLTWDAATAFLETRRYKVGTGATHDEARRSLPGDDLVPSPKSGYTQAITIGAPKSEVWPWLVQIGYKRAGWYTHDFLHRLVGIAGCVDDERCSAKRIIPELQDLAPGDVIEIAPGMGYAVVALEPEQAMVLQSILDTSKWESVASEDPLPEKYLRSSWVWFLEEMGPKTTRLIVRVRNDHDPGLMSTMSTNISNVLGRRVMQPKTLRVLKQRAEMNAG
jgi:proline iminopeptidase